MKALKKPSTFYLFVIYGLMLTACQGDKNQVTKHQIYVFGTLAEISIWSEENSLKEQAINQIILTFNTMHHQWHAWKPGRLNDINQALRSGQSISLVTEEAKFIFKTIELAQKSNHFFNPAMGELINLWGFHADEYPLLTPPPTDIEIQNLIEQNITVENLDLNGLTLSSDNPHIWLDLGGIAKGYAIDVAVDILKEQGIENAIINAGGDLRSIGNKGNIEKPWRVAIQSPTDWSMLAEIEVNGDESIFTSGNYQRYKEFNGKRYAHIIDSRTGMPVDSIVSATVITDNGILADAAATALVVAGDNWPQVAASLGIDQALIINDELQCFGTAKILKRLKNPKIECEMEEL